MKIIIFLSKVDGNNNKTISAPSATQILLLMHKFYLCLQYIEIQILYTVEMIMYQKLRTFCLYF